VCWKGLEYVLPLSKSVRVSCSSRWRVGPSCARGRSILLEEPYSLDGSFAGTGHSAVYLSNVCAASPTSLRRCNPGELGVVLSRYHHIAGYDWVAVPSSPIFTLSKSRKNPSICGLQARLVFAQSVAASILQPWFPIRLLRSRSGDWYQLAGSAYDRTLYGFQLPTSPMTMTASSAKFNSAKSSSLQTRHR